MAITATKVLAYTSYLTPEKNAMISDPFVIANSSRVFERTDVPVVMLYGTTNSFYTNTVVSDSTDIYENTNFQYVKHGLDIKIKIVEDQTDRWNRLNYVMIENNPGTSTDTEICVGYFIVDKKWISSNCVELSLKMDVLNTYSGLLMASTRNVFSPNSKILRAHQDRFNETKTKYLDPATSYTLHKHVNENPEGVQTPTLLQTSCTDIRETVAPDQKWYLVYTADDQQATTGVSCYAVPENNTPFDEGGVNMSITKSILDGGAYVFMALDDNNGVTINFTEHYPNEGTSRSWTVSNSTIVAVASRSSGNYLSMYKGSIDSDNGHITWDSSIWSENLATVIAPHAYRRVTSQSWGSGQSISDALDNIYQIEHDYTKVDTSGGQLVYASGIDSWDRTDSKLVKIIELPYAPFTLYQVANHYAVPAYFEFTNNKLKLKNLNAQLSNALGSQSLPDMYITDVAVSESRYARKKDIKYESKLLNSDFRGDKYVYDSYSKPVRYEAMRESVGNIPYMSLTFYPSMNIASNLMFRIVYGAPALGYTYNKIEDYENYLISTRSNESPIYTNAYLDYIRTGYNYDKKAKEQQQIASGVSMGLSAAALVAGIALAGVTGGSSLAIGVSGALGLAGSAAGAVNQAIQNENSLQQKLEAAKAKSASVINADDISLMNVYNGNRLQFYKYEPTETVKNALWDMFHLTGYAYNRDGNIKDFFYSRRCFNFVQADLVDGNDINLLPTDEIKQEIKDKFNEGVTIYHKFYNGTSEIIDWAKEYENFENYICPVKQPIIIG